MLWYISLAVLLPAFCLSEQQNQQPRILPAVVSRGHSGACPSAGESTALRQQISQQISLLLSDSYFVDCCQVKESSSVAVTGKHAVRPCNTSATNQAYCDMETDGGGWVVIQRRIQNGNVDFYRNWTDYVQGFGDLDGEFWYGLENIHCLTTRDDVELRIELGNGATPSTVWTYQLFRVGGASTQYTLTVGQGTGVGDNRDGMDYNDGRPFTTPDMDNDVWSTGNCAVLRQGPWWHGYCSHSNLNGRHLDTYEGIYWYYVNYDNVEMKIRPKRCS